MSKNPLVSVILYAYNCEQFVQQAIQSLLSQDYEPMEFFLSDDGSTDNTFELIQKIAAQTSRKVIVNQNKPNKGICNQINSGIRSTSGSLVLLANADDLYPMDYVRSLIEAWAATDPSPTLVWSTLEQIDERGNPRQKLQLQELGGRRLSQLVRSRFSGPGATGLLFDRRVFEEFGPLPDNLNLEDACINCRAILLGSPLHISKPSVKYRVHDGNISQVYLGGDYESWLVRRKKRAVWQSSEGHRAYIEILRDMYQRPASAHSKEDICQARWIAIEKIMESSILADFYSEDKTVSVSARWATIARIAKLLIKLSVKRWLPFIERRNLQWEYDQYTKG